MVGCVGKGTASSPTTTPNHHPSRTHERTHAHIHTVWMALLSVLTASSWCAMSSTPWGRYFSTQGCILAVRWCMCCAGAGAPAAAADDEEAEPLCANMWLGGLVAGLFVLWGGGGGWGDVGLGGGRERWCGGRWW